MTNAMEIANYVAETELKAILDLKDMLAAKNSAFPRILEEILACKGKVVLTGAGKSGHIAQKISATMSSLGTPSVFMHPCDSMHGDLGMLQESDLLIAISKSGESHEITLMFPNLKRIGLRVVGLTCVANSALARNSNICEILPQSKEACLMGLAPTSTTTAALVYGDALAVAASAFKKFRQTDFGLLHPAGALGKKIREEN